MNTYERIAKERENAKDALIKLGYIKTAWGWLIPNRIDALVAHGIIRTAPTLAYTEKSRGKYYQVLQYLQGHIDNIQ